MHTCTCSIHIMFIAVENQHYLILINYWKKFLFLCHWSLYDVHYTLCVNKVLESTVYETGVMHKHIHGWHHTDSHPITQTRIIELTNHTRSTTVMRLIKDKFFTHFWNMQYWNHNHNYQINYTENHRETNGAPLHHINSIHHYRLAIIMC